MARIDLKGVKHAYWTGPGQEPPTPAHAGSTSASLAHCMSHVLLQQNASAAQTAVVQPGSSQPGLPLAAQQSPMNAAKQPVVSNAEQSAAHASSPPRKPCVAATAS